MSTRSNGYPNHAAGKRSHADKRSEPYGNPRENHGPPRRRPDRVQPTAISAPYNFVPLADWVHVPDWAARVSLDRPFEDGLCGEIPYTLVADTPLLVGREAERSKGEPGVVHFFQTPDKRYAIPGSSLRGMLRAVVEIAAFGRMRTVDDARHGLRDISSRAVKDAYSGKVVGPGKVRTGFLRRGPDGGREIVPCRMARLNQRDLETWLGVPRPVFRNRMSVGEKYQRWVELARMKKLPDKTLCFDPPAEELGIAKSLGHGRATGVPVFTGQISNQGYGEGFSQTGKYLDFIFHDRDDAAAFPVTDDDWRAFLLVHGDEDGNATMSWPGHWRQEFQNGGDVPVFYVPNSRREGVQRAHIGLAYLPKLAWDFSIHDLIRHSCGDHLETLTASRFDLADLLFGALGQEQEDALRGRVEAGLALASGAPQPESPAPTILNGPKPTYFPNYLCQKTDRSGLKLATDRNGNANYATCIETPSNPAPKLRGFKRYPARPKAEPQRLSKDQKKNKAVQVQLHPLPAGTKFMGRIRFHNLKPVELGALLWAVSWGGNASLRHGLGMGKSFGYGQVHFEIAWQQCRLRANKPPLRDQVLDPEPCLSAFSAHMEKVAAAHGGWCNSPQIENLLAMADPARAQRLPNGMELRHMQLETKEFTTAKNALLVLGDYARCRDRATPSTPPPTPDAKDRNTATPAPGSAGSATRPLHSGGGSTATRALGEPKHPWLKKTCQALADKHNIKLADDLWGGTLLATEWAKVEDAETRQAVLAEIRQYWESRSGNWWLNPPTRAKKKAKATYAPDTD